MISLDLSKVAFRKTVNNNNQMIGMSINNKGLTADSVSFSGGVQLSAIQQRMRTLAIDIIESQIKLKPEQPILVKYEKEFVPFVEIFAEEAYKRHSGKVEFDAIDKKADALYEKYCKYPKLEWKNVRDAELKSRGAAFMTFDETNSPYKLANFSAREIVALKKTFEVKIPAHVQKKLRAAFNPEEIFKIILNVQKGQPIKINAEREHEANVLRFVKYAYKHDSGPIEISYNEPGGGINDLPYKSCKIFYQHADEKDLTNMPKYFSARWQEYIDKKVIGFFPEGENPEELAGVDAKRITMADAALKAVSTPIRNSVKDYQWNIYYAPTTMSVKKPYSEYPNIMDALGKGAEDAKLIDRCGHLKEHAANLKRVAQALNDHKFDRFHFYSVDPLTGQPDKKTDLIVGMSSKAKFSAATEKTADGVEYIPNTPSEEIFSVPDKTRTNGWVSATMPLTLNGNIVEGIRMRFENGKAVEVYADKNQELLRELIAKFKGADMLGEVAAVADSRIFKTGKIFNTTLLDENAAPHIALGKAFPECIEGAYDIEDPVEREAFLRANNVNICDTHNDFMIGGPYVIMEGITTDGKIVTIIRDNKFQI